MKVALSIILYLVLLFILPLAASLYMIQSPYVILSAVVIVLLLTTQPQMNLGEATRDKRTDGGTIYIILGMGMNNT
ncbi:hypothetical protein [Zobellia roscoffensis]|uniref:hypothetical protein n=1 Tax=Zobellia roscoffensis TaxID=2779508 RepID=UPI00188B2893|nr:hypothetical protein [Zobellia roscoffensis]